MLANNNAIERKTPDIVILADDQTIGRQFLHGVIRADNEVEGICVSNLIICSDEYVS